jgi:hypothetical protein
VRLLRAQLSQSGYTNPAVPDKVDANVVLEAWNKNSAINSPERKVIHSANFQCKVKNVFNAATRLEQMVKSLGGVVEQSKMENGNYDTSTSYYTADSLRQTITYTTTATLILRVPTTFLDSVVNEVPRISTFVESRILKQSDVTYRFLSNELKNQIGDTRSISDAARKLCQKSKEPIEIQEYQDNKQEQKIDRKLDNMALLDDVNYATVFVSFTQPEQVYIQTIVNPNYYTGSPYMLQFKEAMGKGFDMIKQVVISFVSNWPLWMLFLAVFIFIIRMRRKRKLATEGIKNPLRKSEGDFLIILFLNYFETDIFLVTEPSSVEIFTR